MLDSMTRMEARPGEELFRQGDEVKALFVVVDGELRVSKRLLEDDHEELHVSTLGPGSYVGDGLFHKRPCAESVVVQQPSVLWRLCRDEFYAVIDGLAGLEEPEECEVNLDQPRPEIFVVSDGSGYSAGGAVDTALKQFGFNSCTDVSITNFPFVRYAGEVTEITRRALAESALVVYTLMREEPRQAMVEEVRNADGALRTVDLWEPLLQQMEQLLGSQRKHEFNLPAMRPSLSEECLRMVEAIEYTRKLDDGVNPERWKEADVLLIGLSRAGKTPLSTFLAQRGFKVANYPVVPEEEPPKELFDPGIQHKCIGLTIKAERLQVVRSERMKDFGHTASTYSSLQHCTKEVNWLKTFYMRRGPRWPIIDTTFGMEESAAKIIKILAQRVGSTSSGRYANPSVA